MARVASRRFGAFEVQVDTGELRRDGSLVPLQPQPARVLAFLVLRAGELVSREDLRRHVWGDDVHVDFDQGLNFCIRQVRSALGDDPAAPAYIETSPKRGYRFIAKVDEPPPAAPDRGRRAGVRWLAGALGGVVVLAGAAAMFSRAESPLGPASRRLAVLPFVAVPSAAEHEHLADGVTDELISHLSRIDPERLAVIARTSSMRYKGVRRTVPEIAEDLDVDYVVEGQVREQAGGLRMTARLVRARDAAALWSEGFDGPSLEGAAAALAARIATTLQAGAAARPSATPTAIAPAAREAYLRGRYHVAKGTPEEAAAALVEFERAVALEPGMAPAWVGVADALFAMPGPPERRLPRARNAALEALRLSPDSAEAHHRLAGIHLYFDWDWEAARREYERALALAPGLAVVHHSYAAYFSIQGRHDEALERIRKALELDPVSASVTCDTGWYFYWARRYDEAIAQSERALALEPTLISAHTCILHSLAAQGRGDAAVARARRIMELQHAPAGALADLERRGGSEGLRPYWEWYLSNLEARAATGYVSPSLRALALPVVGADAALRALEQSFEQRSGWVMPFLAVEPRLDPLRSDPRYADLAARLRLPAPPSAAGAAAASRAPAR